MNKQKAQHERLLRRKKRIRARVTGSLARPRLSLFRSSKHIYASLIDDEQGRTLVTVSDRSKVAKAKKDTKQHKAHSVGTDLAKAALSKGISKVVFDRNGRVYRGRVKELAEGAREGGLKF